MRALWILLIAIVVSSSAIETLNQDPVIAGLVNQISQQNLQNSIRKLVSFKTRNTLSATNDPLYGIGAAREWLKAEMERYSSASGGRLAVSFDTFIAQGGSMPYPVEARNVIGVLPGINVPADILIVSAHYDSRASNRTDPLVDAPGADDDASGVALVLETARILAPHKFQATIIFVAFVAEEQGLLGAHNLASRAKRENWNVVAQLNNDIVGSSGLSSQTNISDNLHVRVFSPASSLSGYENDGPARQLARYVKEVGQRYVRNMSPVLILRQDRILRGGDHTPFLEAGYRAVRLTETNENFDRQHNDIRVENGVQFGDLEEFIDYNYLQRVTGINLAVLANLALAPNVPVNATIANKNLLDNNSVISWKASSNGKASDGFYVLWRGSDEIEWSQKIFTRSTSVTLPLSKDNHIFAVQAVDQDGHESIAVLAA